MHIFSRLACHPCLGLTVLPSWEEAGTPFLVYEGLPYPCPLRGTRPECRPGPKPTLLHRLQSNHSSFFYFFFIEGRHVPACLPLLLLLHSGDIETNPGPYLCPTCNRPWTRRTGASSVVAVTRGHITTYDALGYANTHTSHRDGDVYNAIPHTTRLLPPLSSPSTPPLSVPSPFPPPLPLPLLPVAPLVGASEERESPPGAYTFTPSEQHPQHTPD